MKSLHTEGPLRVFTRRLEPLHSFIPLAHPTHPMIWVKDDRGVVGAGTALKLNFSGVDRFRDASAAWRDVRERAIVSDGITRPGTGLIAFGTFAFADDSHTESVLLVPSMMLGFHDDEAWVTAVFHDGDEIPAVFTDGDPETTLAAEPIVEMFLARHTPHSEVPDWSGVEFAAQPAELEAYRQGVLEVNDRIVAGEAQKIVLARTLHTTLDPAADLRVPLTRLAETYTDCWTFAVDGMLGSSPETLIRSIGGEVTARVLAGTRKRSADLHKDLAMRDELQASEKEQFEHALAVASLVETVTPHVTDLHADAEPYLLELPNVWHLATNIIARLADSSDVLTLAGDVHPTAAVAGTPTPVAVGAIAEIEPFDRGRYAGAVGWIDHRGFGDWAIALRCAQVHDTAEDRTITAYAGGGLVAGSDPERELTETIAKFRPITEAFA